MDPVAIVGEVNNIYNLIAMSIIAIVYLVIFFKQQKNHKSQTQVIIDEFNKSNENILTKLEELKEQRNTLDLQSSMDILESVFDKSMYKIKYDLNTLIINGYSTCDDDKINLLYNKVKSIVYTQYDEDLIILNRIYHENTKLSSYLTEFDVSELVTTIVSKLGSNDENIRTDIMEYIKNKYSHAIHTIHLNLSK